MILPALRHSLLPRVAASFSGIVLGLAGLANTWRVAHSAWRLPSFVGEILTAVAVLAWFVIATLYALKWIVASDEARSEAEHAVQCCFIGLGGVATVLIAQGILPYSRLLAIVLFTLGAIFIIGFALWRTGFLWRGGRDEAATTPVLYLPTVAGGLVTGTTAAVLGAPDWGQLGFGAALFSWFAIESVLLQQKIILGTANELSCVARQLAVGNSYATNLINDIRRRLVDFRRERLGLTVWRQDDTSHHNG